MSKVRSELKRLTDVAVLKKIQFPLKWTHNREEFNYDKLARILMFPGLSAPDELLEALHCVDHLARPKCSDQLLLRCRKIGIDADDGTLSPADLALRVWLHNREIIETMRREKCRARPRKFVSWFAKTAVPPDGSIVAVSNDDWEDIELELTRDDIVQHELLACRFVEAIGKALSLRTVPLPPDAIGLGDIVIPIGSFEVSPGDEYPVSAVLTSQPNRLLHEVLRLVVFTRRPVLVLTPTCDAWSDETREALKLSNGLLVPLHETIILDGKEVEGKREVAGVPGLILLDCQTGKHGARSLAVRIPEVGPRPADPFQARGESVPRLQGPSLLLLRAQARPAGHRAQGSPVPAACRGAARTAFH